MRATSAPACWPPKRSAAGSRKVARAMSADVADFDDLELACPAGRLDRHLVALVLADQRTRDRRRNRDLAVLDVGFQVTHDRSEEHTSELQSLMRISYAVFCLKKKKK